MTQPLSDKQQRFVLEYLQDHNATAAARRAGYSDSTRGSHAATLMKNPLVAARIQEETAAMFARLRVTAFTLMQAQARAAFFDPRKMFDEEGELLPVSQMDEDTACALTVSCDQGRRGQTLRVRQAPRHLAVAALQKNYTQFVQQEMNAVVRRGMVAAQGEQRAEEPQGEPQQEPAETESASAKAGPTLSVVPPQTASRPVPATPLLSRAARRAAARTRTGAQWQQSGLLRGIFAAPSAQKQEAEAACG